MIPLFLRLGPMVFVQISLGVVGLFLYVTSTLSTCYCFTFIGFCFELFLAEMIVALRMLKVSKSLRIRYLLGTVKESKCVFWATQFWNIINLVTVMVLLLSRQILDLVTLAQFDWSKPVRCTFTSYTVCLFMEVTQFKVSSSMVVALLYTCGLFIDALLIVFCTIEYCFYLQKMMLNRVNDSILTIDQTQSLLDCKLYNTDDIKCVREECAICKEYIKADHEINQYIVQLKCKHVFHRGCIVEWFKEQDNCPFRCHA